MIESSPNHANERENSEYPNLRFEPGLHERVDTPRPDWNRQMARRLSQYNPEFLSIDGMQGGSDLQFSLSLSEGFPGRPDEINTKSEYIYIVRGDVFDYTQSNWSLEEQVAQALSDTNQLDKEARGGVVTEIFAASVLSSVILGVSNRPVITRRDFLKKTLAYSAAFAIFGSRAGQVASMIAAPFTPSETQRDVLLRVARLTKPILTKTLWWVDGRTALLIAKTQDAIDLLQKPRQTSGAIVMGNAHMFMAETLLRDRSERQQKIRDFAKYTLETADSVLAEVQAPLDLQEQTRNAILNQISLFDILKIPTQSSSIELVSFHRSPQVEAALRDFR